MRLVRRGGWLVLALSILACAAEPPAAVKAPPRRPEPPAAEPVASTQGSPAPNPTAAPAETAPSFKQAVVSRERTRIVVLEYHDFGNVDRPSCVSPDSFKAQLDWLTENKIEVVRTSNVIDFYTRDIELPERVAVVMIDDALTSAKNHAFPALKARGMPFTLAVNTAPVEMAHEDALSWADLKTMLESGLVEIASHSHKHGHMANLTDFENNRELNVSKALIEEKLGVVPRAFVYPFGSVNPTVQKLTELAGYEVGFDALGPVATSLSPRFRLPRTAVTREMKLWHFKGMWKREFGASAPQKTAPPDAAPILMGGAQLGGPGDAAGRTAAGD